MKIKQQVESLIFVPLSVLKVRARVTGVAPKGVMRKKEKIQVQCLDVSTRKGVYGWII